MPRIAHISDLHFAKPSKNPLQIFSKRWIGNLNLLLSRKKKFTQSGIQMLPALFLEKKIDIVLISGDLSCTSYSSEFSAARQLIEEFHKNGLEVHLIPGNHDQYTKKSFKQKLFYKYFLDPDLEKRGVARKKIADKWWVVLVDSAIPTNWLSSCGEFRKEIESNLLQILDSIDPHDSIILLNHFPLFQNKNPRNRLKRANALQEVIYKYPNIRMYLHGHTHRHSIADLRNNQYPIVLDAGCVAEKTGTWNLIDIQGSSCKVESYQLDAKTPSWEVFKTSCFDL